MSMTPEQEARHYDVPSQRRASAAEPDVPWLKRLELLRLLVDHDRAMYEELYAKGGGHPKDAAIAALLIAHLHMMHKLFPELQES